MFLPEPSNMYRAHNMSKSIHIAVQYIITTMCASAPIAPVNMSEDLCAAHFGFSICFPTMGAIHVVIDRSAYCLGQYVLNRLL